MADLMTIGAPVYWIVRGPLNYSDSNVQDIICGGVGCSDYSLTVQLYTASQQSDMCVDSIQLVAIH